jgi:anti-anti-sigma regulatory factor
MALQFLSHSWEVKNVPDGIMVEISHQELDSETILILADELFELAMENGQPNLWVDFVNLRSSTDVVFEKLTTLDKRLRDMGCRLIVCNIEPDIGSSMVTC